MARAEFFVGEIANELLDQLRTISRQAFFCKSSADQLKETIDELLPIIQEIKCSGVELPSFRQAQLDGLSKTLRDGLDLCKEVLKANRWNAYKNVQLARKMDKLEKKISGFFFGIIQAHVLADVHRASYQTTERFDRLERSTRRIEQRLESMKTGVAAGGWVEHAMIKVEMEEKRAEEGNFGNFIGVGIALGKKKVKEMIIGREDWSVVGILGIGGSGKTTLATEVCRDFQVTSYFNNRILFLTVSKSPNVELLKTKVWSFVSGCDVESNVLVPPWNLQVPWNVGSRCLVVLDDVWSLAVLQQLTCRLPGCKTLVVSRTKFSTALDAVYEVELLREDESISLFCHAAFGQKTIPPAANENLVKEIVKECGGLPLALKVIGASLKDRPEKYWASAQKRLSRGQPICESHEINLLYRMAISVEDLSEKVKECFLDLGSFPEDRKIPMEVLINTWVEIHDIDEDDAFAIIMELCDRNLLSLVKDSRAIDMYSAYYEMYVTQHDVLRDLALHLNDRDKINDRKRLLMPRRDAELPKEWERNVNVPFNAWIVSIHTGEMRKMDWLGMEFPKTEVLLLNFSSKEYFLPSFIRSMKKLRALTMINHSSSPATLGNFAVCSNLATLRSLWLERLSISQLAEATICLRNLRKLSLVLCKINGLLDQPMIDLPKMFPHLLEFTIDHCHDLIKLPPSICRLQSLRSLSITNCHSLLELPADIGKLKSLQFMRLYASLVLKTLPTGISELVCLKYLNISQCVSLTCLPQGIGHLAMLEKIDMRECSHIGSLPKSAASLKALRQVICDDDVAFLWKDMKKTIPGLNVQVPEKKFSLDWLNE
ncbi:probable disease resistance protein At4g33300 [Mangifera indica]|uniref:probable disease resistance protein At4g33300 n=1 Tax=Mangifera indica TaxID=29780 RepID=UPI001CF9D4B2|nr:probable disease resistance protein At4g33300 [Mangifera indica]